MDVALLAAVVAAGLSLATGGPLADALLAAGLALLLGAVGRLGARVVRRGQDGSGRPLSTVTLCADGSPVDRAPGLTKKELDALWRARRVLAGGAS